ncbi:MAG: hypothetical protein QHI38_03585 [Armatimonadota bacterium]|nr:hypothetical protein [Armatimonadota bacterium]
MNIKPSSTAGLNLAYAVGWFAEDDSFVVTQLGGESPLGSTLVGLGSDYAVHISPDGAGWSTFAGLDITSPLGTGKGWYIRDRETGAVWSPFFLPAGEKADDFEVRFFPGQVTAYALKNKIGASLTITALPNKPVEVWLVKLENRSARERSLTFTTYFEPCVGQGLETCYKTREKLLLMRRSLSSAVGDAAAVGDMVLFHGSTLTPVRFQTDKMRFIGDGRTLKNPLELDSDAQPPCEGIVENPAASFTVDIELPIEGEAEFGFYVGVARNPEHAIDLAKGLNKSSLVREAVHMARMKWESACSLVRLDSPDHVLNAFVNTWLPYEAYAGWMRQRTGGVCLDPLLVADCIRRYYPICAAVPDAARSSLVSFAAGLSLSGAYTEDNKNFASLPLSELIWLPLTVARYVVETGDAAILAETVQPLEGAGEELTLQDQCERILEICAASPSEAGPLFPRALIAWRDILESCAQPRTAVEEILHSDRDSQDPKDTQKLPRRIRHMLAASALLNEARYRSLIEAFFASENAPVGDCAVACVAFTEITEKILGVLPLCEGLELSPHLPDSWHDYEITRQLRGDKYKIHVKRSLRPSKARVTVTVDGIPINDFVIPEFSDGLEHMVEVVFS